MMVIMGAVGGSGISGGNGGGGGTSEGTERGGDYVSKLYPNMSWAQGDENYYVTQDTDHEYKPGIWKNNSIWKD